MVQKTNGKQLAAKYKDFLDPAIQVLAAGQQIAAEKGRTLEIAEITASAGRDPDMAVLVYRVEKIPSANLQAMEKFLNVGEKLEVKTGYEKSLTRIFLGYLHQVEMYDCGQEMVEYTLICLDAKGLMKKNSSFQASGSKKIQQLLTDTLNNSSYGSFIEKKSVASLPASLNQDCVIKGETHYDWLCNLADSLDYEFFCGRGELIFRKARENAVEIMELTEEYGLQAVRRVVSMAGVTGSIQVNGYNRKDEKITATAQWSGMSEPFGQKMKKALAGCSITLWDMELENGEQAAYRAKTVLNRAAAKCSRMEVINVGIPELQPGVFVKITKENMTSLSGKIYVDEVQHILDRRGYRTIVRGGYDF